MRTVAPSADLQYCEFDDNEVATWVFFFFPLLVFRGVTVWRLAAGVCGGLQPDGGPLPAQQHRQDHRPGGPGENEPSAHDAAVVRGASVPHARRLRRSVRLLKRDLVDVTYL